VAIALGNKREDGANRGVPASVRQRRCFGRRRSPRRRCFDYLRRLRAGPAARCGGGGSEGLLDQGKRERTGRNHRGKGNGGTAMVVRSPGMNTRHWREREG
jgi:hypothetical protein